VGSLECNRFRADPVIRSRTDTLRQLSLHRDFTLAAVHTDPPRRFPEQVLVVLCELHRS
jgi:hypothetical protein